MVLDIIKSVNLELAHPIRLVVILISLALFNHLAYNIYDTKNKNKKPNSREIKVYCAQNIQSTV